MNERAWAKIPLFLVFVGCAAQGADDAVERTEESAEHREPIVGGQTTSAYPAVGALTRFGSTHCTGTVVAARTVVTAAHCVKGFSANSMKFVLGSNASSPTATINVASLKAHPGYNAAQLTNDIGIVTLAADAPVAPMKVMPSLDSSWVGKQVVFVGFGVSNGSTQTGAGLKRFVQMPIASIGATQFEYAVAGKNTCNGDSGGPAFAEVGGELLLAGVTSYGDATCKQYGVDTRVDVYKDFVGVGGGTTDPCNGETFAGRCDGATVVWCENQQVKQQNCSAQNKVCGFSAQNQYYGCIDPAPQDPCNGETFAGRCEGKKLIWCENQQVKNLSCSNQCGFNAQQGYYDCL